MTVELPTTPGTYVSAAVDPDVAEPFALTAMGRWLWFRGPEITPAELEELAPMVRLVALTDEERDAVNEVATQIAKALHLDAVARARWGTSQPALTRSLIDADVWHSIAEKTRAS